ncbi:MAG: hypothetical protein AAF773_09150 [Cyanobacteria bacterium P01_D01_bin.115]
MVLAPAAAIRPRSLFGTIPGKGRHELVEMTVGSLVGPCCGDR